MIKRKLFVGVALLCSLFFSLPASAQSGLNDFRITSFDADYYLSRNEIKTPQLRVFETIVANFPNANRNHGIERAIPTSYNDNTLSLEIESVKDEKGSDLPYTTYNSNDNMVVRIGDADTYVLGEKTYKIIYTMRNVINYQELDEFFWDVNGDQWLVSFDEVSATIHVSKDLEEAISPEMKCFTGSFGDKGEDCTIIRSDSEEGVTINVKSSLPLLFGQNMSFVIGFEKGTFEMGPEPAAYRRQQMFWAVFLIGSVLLPILFSIGFIIRRYRKFGRDPEGRGSITPQYIPLKELNTLSSQAILKEAVSSKAISAAIVELAIARYITIYETAEKSKKFEVELIKDPSDLPSSQQEVISALFTSKAIGTRVALSSLQYKLYTALTKINEMILEQLTTAAYFKDNPKKVSKKYIKIGVIMMILSFVIGFLLFTVPFSIGLFIGGLIVTIASGAMPAKTAKGVEAKEYLLGLKMYMKLAEKERIAFSQSLSTAERVDASPDNDLQKIKLFERLLPYAILFGLEKEWAKEFANLYQKQPDWYSGSSSFNAAVLASSIGSFSSSATHAFSPPSSSGGSGFSAGGFSGGGGGGGGGGGW